MFVCGVVLRLVVLGRASGDNGSIKVMSLSPEENLETSFFASATTGIGELHMVRKCTVVAALQHRGHFFCVERDRQSQWASGIVLVNRILRMRLLLADVCVWYLPGAHSCSRCMRPDQLAAAGHC